MDQVETSEQEQEIVQAEVAPPQTEDQQEKIESQEEKPAEKSWVNRLRRDRDEAVRKLKMQEELMQRFMTQQQSQMLPQPVDEDVIGQLAKEEYVPGAKVAEALKKLDQNFSKKVGEIENKYAQVAMNSQYQKLKAKYPDLTEVVNPETLEILKETNPEAAEVLYGKDDYSIYVLAYPIIKASDILDQVKGVRRSKEVEKKIEQNKKTTPSPQSFDKRPMAQAFNYERLSPEQKNALQAEMFQYASLASSVKPMG